MEGIHIYMTFITIIAIILFLYFYRRIILSNTFDEISPEIVILVKDAQDEIEGIVRDFYGRMTHSKELWVVDCYSDDQTQRVLEKVSLLFPGLRLIFLQDIPFEQCIQEVFRCKKSPAILIIDGSQLSHRHI